MRSGLAAQRRSISRAARRPLWTGRRVPVDSYVHGRDFSERADRGALLRASADRSATRGVRASPNASLRHASGRLSATSELEPDFAIVAPRADYYASAHPAPGDTFARVECAESSLAYDRGKKLAVYARAPIGEYWIVNLADGSIEVDRDPNALGYAEIAVAHVGERIAFSRFPNVHFDVTELLGSDPIVTVRSRPYE